jgi:regulator of sigma E protease
LLFYAIEAVRGKPLTERVQEIGFRIGLALVLTLMVFATFNDLHILKRWLVGAG